MVIKKFSKGTIARSRSDSRLAIIGSCEPLFPSPNNKQQTTHSTYLSLQRKFGYFLFCFLDQGFHNNELAMKGLIRLQSLVRMKRQFRKRTSLLLLAQPVAISDCIHDF